MALILRAKYRFLFSNNSHLKFLLTSQRFNHDVSEGGLQSQLYTELSSDKGIIVDVSKWKKINSRFFGLMRSNIPSHAFHVIKILQKEGFEAYLVGGCVRDLLLNRIPKDFDVITTAKLDQIKKQFRRCMIIGRRFPICKVLIKGSEVEVSSFETVAENTEDKEAFLLSQLPRGCDEKDILRWRNSMHRDFTINSLFYDPFMNKIYDYADAIADLRSSKLRTIIPAHLSFQEDCARILRGLRIAGRLGLSISKETEVAMRSLSYSVRSLDKFRKMMELNYMLSYGAAATTVNLLQRFTLLEVFLPFHAAYLDQQTREQGDQNSLMLMKLFFYMDKLVGCDRPCHSNVWVGLLAFHQALVINPQHPFVVWTFASVLYHGKWKAGVRYAKENANLLVRFLPEMWGSIDIPSDEELSEGVAQLGVFVQQSVRAFVDEDLLRKSMARYPVTPSSDLVFVPAKTATNVAQMFEVLIKDIEKYRSPRKGFLIDYFALAKGHLKETRFVLGKVLLDTLSGGRLGNLDIIDEMLEDTGKEDAVLEEEEEALSDLIKHKVVNQVIKIKTEMYEVKKESIIKNTEMVLEEGCQHTDKKIEMKLLLEEELKAMRDNMTSNQTDKNDQMLRKQEASMASESVLHGTEASRLNVNRSSSASNKDKTKQMEMQDRHQTLEVIKENEKCTTMETVDKEKKDHPPQLHTKNQPPSLSSFFKRKRHLHRL